MSNLYKKEFIVEGTRCEPGDLFYIFTEKKQYRNYNIILTKNSRLVLTESAPDFNVQMAGYNFKVQLDRRWAGDVFLNFPIMMLASKIVTCYKQDGTMFIAFDALAGHELVHFLAMHINDVNYTVSDEEWAKMWIDEHLIKITKTEEM